MWKFREEKRRNHVLVCYPVLGQTNRGVEGGDNDLRSANRWQLRNDLRKGKFFVGRNPTLLVASRQAPWVTSSSKRSPITPNLVSHRSRFLTQSMPMPSLGFFGAVVTTPPTGTLYITRTTSPELGTDGSGWHSEIFHGFFTSALKCLDFPHLEGKTVRKYFVIGLSRNGERPKISTNRANVPRAVFINRCAVASTTGDA